MDALLWTRFVIARVLITGRYHIVECDARSASLHTPEGQVMVMHLPFYSAMPRTYATHLVPWCVLVFLSRRAPSVAPNRRALRV
jgi:hypothetical protein